jgi:hypothetical protein
MPRFKMEVRFELDASNLTSDEAEELCGFVMDALEAWGGQRHPDDWLFGSLENVHVKQLEQMFQRGGKVTFKELEEA